MRIASLQSGPTRSITSWPWGLIAFLLGFAAVFWVRLTLTDSLWIDELWAADLSDDDIFPKLFEYKEFAILPPWAQGLLRRIHGLGPFAQLLLRTAISDTSPPAYYFFMQAWTSVLGVSELALRLPSVLFQLATLALLVRMFARFERPVLGALLVSILLTNPVQVYLATEARPYAMLQFLVLLHLYLSLGALRQERLSRRRTVAMFGAATLAMYTHYMGCLFVLATTGAVAVAARADRGIRYRRLWAPSLAAFGAFAIWIPVVLLQASKEGRLGYLRPLDMLSLLDVFYWNGPLAVLGINVGARPWLGASSMILWLAASAWLWRAHPPCELFREARILVGVQLLVLGLILGIGWMRPVYSAKNFSGLIVPTIVPVLVGLHVQWPRWRFSPSIGLMCVFIGAALACALMGVNPAQLYMNRPDWKGVAAYVRELAPDHDVILVSEQHERSPFMYYYAGTGHWIDEVRAAETLMNYKVRPLYDLKLHPDIRAASAEILGLRPGERAILVDGSGRSPVFWRPAGLALSREFKAVRVYVSTK